ncbi:MAG TPA: ABC transporter substrate-binding protein [Acidiphilium sp.]
MKRNKSGFGVGRMAMLAAAGVVVGGIGMMAAQAALPPIKIGVIGEESSVAGASLTKAAQLAADEINAKGGIGGRTIQLFTFDDHSSAADAVRAYQRAVEQDHVNAVLVSYESEIALAVEPWAARLHMPTITPGAASTKITEQVHADYNKYKYMFDGWMNSEKLASVICMQTADLLVKPYGLKTAAIMSEDAAWTLPLDKEYMKCLPKAGVKVLSQMRFNPDTNDFTAIFQKIEAEHPQMIVAGISHVGVQPTVQWSAQQVPIPMTGQSSQATTSSFWKDTNGAAEGVITATAAAPGVALTPKTIPFTEAYTKRYGATPAYDGYSAYDDVYVIAEAVKRAGSTDPDKLVTALEKTDYMGTLGRVAFYGKDSPYTNSLKVGPDYIMGTAIQWQNGKQVCVWPRSICKAKLVFPSFIKMPAEKSGQN